MSAFTLTVPVGSIVHSSGGKSLTLSGVPENAQELWEDGSRFLKLKKDGAEILDKYSKTALEKLLATRRKHDFADEISLIEKALKAKNKEKEEQI